MSLQTYRRKRHFDVTPEPSGKTAAGKGRAFVIQKHDASHLHYDFRLEQDGVLKSWAVPKGPSLDPRDKRLAIEVEDHPVDYGDFEGTIPQGEYGGGTVMLWDRGTWEPIGDPDEGLRTGKLKFQLHGEKLHGGWMLVRRQPHHGKSSSKPQWLLFKERDDEARDDSDILEEEPLSVKTGRDLDEIASGKKAEARKRLATTSKKTTTRKKTKAESKDTAPSQSSLPKTIEPELATLAKAPPEGPQWAHEIKFDGYRILSRLDHGKVTLFSRRGQDWTDRMERIARALEALPAKTAWLDGEVVALEPDGTSNFQLLQNAFGEDRTAPLVYYVFDLLYLDGRDLRSLPLEERKEKLATLLKKSRSKSGPIRYSDHVVGDGDTVFAQAGKLGLEGIVSKRLDRPYRAGRGYDWLKIKTSQREEFVIGGYTDPEGSREAFGSLLVGYHVGSDLRYAGKVGTGFSHVTLRDLFKRLKPLERKSSPFSDLTTKTGEARHAHWVEPELVAQIEFGNWTRDGRLRHPSFLGLREDKPAAEVVRDRPISGPVDVTSNGKAHAKSGHIRKPKPPSRNGHVASGDEFAGVRLSHPDKVLYPDQGITKRDLAEYYTAVAEWILPHLEDRPLVLVRCPEGAKKTCFFQKHLQNGVPEALRRVTIKEKDKQGDYALVDDLAGLISLVQMGVLEIHAWGSRADRLEQPDRLVFDLDPAPDVGWERVVRSAHQIREFLDDLGLRSFVKTTGGKGLHLVVPIQRRQEWGEISEFCQAVVRAIVTADPKHYTSNMSKAARPGKIFVDYLRNARGATAVAPYSTRARAGAPVSMPLDWDDLKPSLTADRFTVSTAPAYLAKRKRDPWRDISKVKQSLTSTMRKTLGL
jgi:bifunctional non-homologous end joining protein LigD